MYTDYKETRVLNKINLASSALILAGYDLLSGDIHFESLPVHQVLYSLLLSAFGREVQGNTL